MPTVNNPTGLGICPALLLSLGAVNAQNNPAAKAAPAGLLQALYDPANRAGTALQQLDGGSGHRPQVRVVQRQRIPASSAATAKSCDAGTEAPVLETLTTIGQYREVKVTVSEATIRQMCAEASQYADLVQQPAATAAIPPQGSMAEVVERVLLAADGLRQAINTDLAVLVQAQVGAFAGPGAPTAPLPIPVLKAADGAPVLKGHNILLHQYRRALMRGRPLVVGFGVFEQANRALQYGCCNAGGTDFGRMNAGAPYQFYEDFGMGEILDAETGQDDILVLAPGVAQVVTYNEYVGEFARSIDSMERGVFPDPVVPGLLYDIRVFGDKCTEAYTVILGLHYDLWVSPAISTTSGDALEGVNGIFHFTAQEV